MTLRVITAPAAEPVSTATAKSHLRVDGTDDDTLIASLIKSARQKAEEISRRAFITQTLEMTIDAWPSGYILELLRPPLLTVTSVKYTDEDNVEHTMSASDYTVDIASEPGKIIFDSYPTDDLRDSGAITIRYTAGYGAADTNVPDSIKSALLALIAYWYENREITEVPAAIRSAFLASRVVWF